MRYLGAYILATLGGNVAPTADDLKKILNSVGAGIEEERLEKVITLLKGKDLDQLMTEGSQLLASFSSGPVAAPAASTGAAAQAAEPAKEEKKEEPKEEEEEDDDMGFGLFD